MKIYPATKMILEWLSGGDYLWEQGGAKPSLEDKWAYYTQHGGKLAYQDYKDYTAYALANGLEYRPKQAWQDYTEAKLDRPAAMDKIIRHQHKKAVYVLCMGMRADEGDRVERLMEREMYNEGSFCSKTQTPPGQHTYFPLYESKVVKSDVNRFWADQSYDLDIPYWAGNCTFCFLKSDTVLADGAQQDDPRRVPDTPSDMNWWIRMEEQYGRTRGKAEGTFGFKGVNKRKYRTIKMRMQPPLFSPETTESLACECTD